MVDPRAWVDRMLGAIEDEMKARRRPEGVQKLLVGMGRRAPDMSPSERLYLFSVPSQGRVPGLLGGDLHIPDQRVVPVRVASWPANGPLGLSMKEDLGPEIGHAELHYHDDHVLRTLRQRIHDARDALEGRIVELYSSPNLESSDPVPFAEIGHSSLNAGQRKAVCAAWVHPVARIWGPPGTGKTTTVTTLAAAWIEAGRTLVLSGPTNRSTDLLLLGLLSRLGWHRADVEGRFVRLGTLQSGPLKDEWGDVVDVDVLRERRRARATDELESIREEISKLGAADDGSVRHDPEGELGDWVDERRKALEERRWELEEESQVTSAGLVARAQVVATTAHRVATGQVPQRDAMILDEASMVSLPVGLLATLAARQVTLVGDPRQLGPVVQARTPRARGWLGTSILEDSDPERAAPVIRGPEVLLKEQYRMPPAVCELVSRLSYGGTLRMADACPDYARTSGALSYLNLSERVSPTTGTPERRHENRPQAAVIMKIAEAALHQSPRLGGDIAIISPYRAHVRALRRAARATGLYLEFDISTVHRFQGHEHALVILSIPDRASAGLSPFLRATRISDDGGRLLTVAVSRASERLVVVGDLSGLARTCPPNGVVLTLLRLLKAHGEPLSVPLVNSYSGPQVGP